MKRSEKPTVRLRVRKETLRHLRALGEDELRGAASGWDLAQPQPLPLPLPPPLMWQMPSRQTGC
jgi:hypothetical protein